MPIKVVRLMQCRSNNPNGVRETVGGLRTREVDMRFNRSANSLDLGITIATFVLVFGAANAAIGALAPGDCVDFEDLTPGTVYNVSNSFADSGVTVTAAPFQWSGGTWTSAGFTEVDTSNLAGGLGSDMEVNNITLEFDFGRPVEDLRFLFGEYGGNINLSINGDFRNALNLPALHGQIVGGTLVEVMNSPTGLGVVRITGTVNSFSVGGQELWIDDVCDSTISSDCVDFEDLPYPHSYSYGQFFVDSGAIIELGEFFWFPSGSTTAGSCNVDNSQISGGTGQDVNSNNINLDFDFGTTYVRLDLLYANLGGNINVRVNGALANVANMTDLHLTTLGGASIVVQPPLGNSGQLIVTGTISAFAIGGQELWIDHVCILRSSLFADGFESGNTNAWSLTVP